MSFEVTYPLWPGGRNRQPVPTTTRATHVFVIAVQSRCFNVDGLASVYVCSDAEHVVRAIEAARTLRPVPLAIVPVICENGTDYLASSVIYRGSHEIWKERPISAEMAGTALVWAEHVGARKEEWENVANPLIVAHITAQEVAIYVR